MTPKKAIIMFCTKCCGDNSYEKTLCTDKECHLWNFRLSKTVTNSTFPRRGLRQKARGRAIYHHCLECAGWVVKNAVNCTVSECYLFSYRSGKNPRLQEAGRKRYEKGLVSFRTNNASLKIFPSTQDLSKGNKFDVRPRASDCVARQRGGVAD